MKTTIRMLLAVVALGVGTTHVLAQASTAVKPATPAKKPAKADTTKQPDIGQRKFDANCGRCHTAPQQLSPSLTGTVVRHMRVRANLTAQDEKDILRYLAP